MVNLESGEGARDIAIGDVNEDGRPDLLIANQTAGTVAVFANTTPFLGRPGS